MYSREREIETEEVPTEKCGRSPPKYRSALSFHTNELRVYLYVCICLSFIEFRMAVIISYYIEREDLIKGHWAILMGSPFINCKIICKIIAVRIDLQVIESFKIICTSNYM